MAKKSSIAKNVKRIDLSKKYKDRRSSIKKQIYDKSLSLEQRVELVMALASLPIDSSRTRIRNRCNITGRPRGYYRRFALSRNKLREFANLAYVPGLIKSSW